MNRSRARPAAWLLAASLLPPAFPASARAQDVAAAERLLAAGDTAGALAAYERLVRRRGRDAALRYRLGTLYLSQVVPDQPVSAARRAAETHLRMATRLAPDSAAYWLALAKAFRTETDVTGRLQVADLLQRASAAARRHPGPALAEIEYRLARVSWERYEQAANRHELVDGSDDIDEDRFLNDWPYVDDLFARRLRPSFGGVVEWSETLRHLEAALRAEPDYLEAAGLYVVALGAFDRWDSARAFTGHLVRRTPETGGVWALHGLALARTGDWRQADAAFDSALARWSPAAAAPYLALGRLVSAEQERDLDAMPPPAQVGFAAAHWRAADPLWLTPANEVRSEFRARVAYADHRWSDDLRGHHGYESDRGAVYVRYGPPDVAATLGPGGVDRPALTIMANPGRDDPDQLRHDAARRLDRERNRLLWVYRPSRRRYLFGLVPGYSRAAFAGDAADRFTTDRRRAPRSWDNVAPVVGLDSVAVTTLRFGDGTGGTEMAVFAAVPGALTRLLRSDSASVVALFLERPDTVERLGDRLGAPLSDRVWRWRVPWPEGGARSVRVEALTEAGNRAGRGTTTPDTTPLPTGSVYLSDLLVAGGDVGPGPFERWFDVGAPPLSDPMVAGQPLTLVWEVYGLDSGAEAEYDVEIRLTAVSVARRGLVARVVGGVADALGLSALGDDVVRLRYHRVREPAPALLEYLVLDVVGTTPGTYRVEVTVTPPASAPVTARGHMEVARPP